MGSSLSAEDSLPADPPVHPGRPGMHGRIPGGRTGDGRARGGRGEHPAERGEFPGLTGDGRREPGARRRPAAPWHADDGPSEDVVRHGGGRPSPYGGRTVTAGPGRARRKPPASGTAPRDLPEWDPVRHPTAGDRPAVAHWCGTNVKRTPGSVKLRTGGYSPRPGRCQRPVDQVKFLDRRSKSGWEAVRGGP
ncbi:hypothetical protein GCM10010420_37070 [Streptomyces glaucosporus]|uniref:Uncharacterized protein n=1 Tax=Streptomyces glaucosporus TaxID=284044 RepID=A0ABN3IJV4_9ACTN